MKKILSLILVAVLCIGVLTGCQVIDQVKDLIGLGNQPDVTVEAPTVDDALTVLHNIMKEKNTKPVKDYDLVAQVIAAKGDVKVTFAVEWTCDDETIVIRESTKKGFVTVDLPDENDAEFEYTLTGTVTDAEGNKASKSYTFTLPVVNNTGLTSEPEEGVAYKLFLYQVNAGMRYYALNTDEQNHKYIQTSTDPKAGAEFFVEKVDGGYKWYTLINNVKNYVYAQGINNDGKISKYIGFSTENSSVFTFDEKMGGVWTVTIDEKVYGVGTYGDYTTVSISDGSYYSTSSVGSSQFVLQFVTAEYANTLSPDEAPKEEPNNDPAADSTLTIEQALALGASKDHNKYTEGKYYVTGIINEVTNETYGNMTIKDEKGTILTIYGTFDSTGAKKYGEMETKPVAGDTITVYGIIGQYNGTAQMKNGWITAVNGEGNQGGNPDTPSGDLGIVTNPEVGTAYKFGLYHGNEKATVYFTGNNYTNNKGQTYAWYLEYSKNIADAVDVYLEAVDGGYRLYFMKNDVKTYIVTYQDSREGYEDVGTIKLDTNAPAEFYTFNTEYNTLVWTNAIDKVTYLGSSGTYTSISASKIDYITNATSYVAHLYAEGATGEEAPHTHEFVNGKCACGEVDPDYVAPDMPTDGVYTISQVLAAAEGTEVIVTGTVESFYYDWDDNYGNCSVYIVDEAGNKLLCFRLKTKVAVGDNITVTGTVAVYNGTNQLGAGCTATINGSDSGSDDPVDPNPPASGEMTIPEVLAAADGTDVVVNGIVIIAESWNTQFNNMSVTIRDADGNTLYVYRLATQVGLGDDITITGKVGSYNDAKQIAQGATAVINVVHGDNHTYENGKCTVCDTAEPVAGTKVVECDFSTLAAGTQYADESNTFGDVTVSTHNKGCHFNTQLRIYASDTNNGYAVVKASGVISSLVVNAGYKNSTLEVYGSTDGETWVLIQNVTTTTSYANHTVSIDPSLGYTYLKLDATGNQVRVASLSVTVAQ